MKTKKDYVIEILVDTFSTNKSTKFVVKQDKRAEKRFKNLIEYSYFKGESFGKIILTEDKCACAILLDTRKQKINIESLFWDVKLVVKTIGLKKALRVIKHKSNLKKKYPKDDFLHLWYVGVSPNKQEKGIGTELMRKIILSAKMEKMPLYLETSTIRNFSFYEKLGFREVTEINVAGYPLKVYKYI